MRVRLLCAACLLIGACTQVSSARAAMRLTTGFDNEEPVFTRGTVASRDAWIGRAVNEGAGIVQLEVTWSDIAPAVRPAGFNPTDPSSPGYNWSSTDEAVRDLTGHGLQVLMMVMRAPAWAEGPNKVPVNTGTWRPDPGQYAAFGRAAALRYSGRFPDPLHAGAYLPRVRYWQPWNEPNL